MHFRLLICALATSLLAASARAQTSPADAGTAAADGAAKASAPARKKSKKRTSRSKKTKSSSRKKGKNGKTLQVIKAPAALETAPEFSGPPDDEPPQLSSTSVTRAARARPFTVTAHATDASGIFGPILYVRRKGMAEAEYIPIRMNAAKGGAPGDYAIDVPAALTNVDGLEYYIEVWDNAGNGPIRYGTAESPVQVKVEDEKAPPAPPATVVLQRKGAPPAIAHTALTQALRSQPVELMARMDGDTGVSGAAVLFRHVGEREFKSLPMGNIRGDEYSATVPASIVTDDLEYYIEAYDKFGNGPARSAGPNNPYRLAVGAPTVRVSAAAREAMQTQHGEDAGRNTILGIGLDAGAFAGGGFTLLVRPFWWLRLNGGLAYNYAGLGYRGGISLAPCWCSVTPTLNLDAGHYRTGNFNKIVTVTDPNEQNLLAKAAYTFATAQIGLEFGSQRWFNFYVRAGLQYFTHTFSGADLTAMAQGKISSDPSTSQKWGDSKLSAVLPSASLGFNFFVY